MSKPGYIVNLLVPYEALLKIPICKQRNQKLNLKYSDILSTTKYVLHNREFCVLQLIKNWNLVPDLAMGFTNANPWRFPLISVGLSKWMGLHELILLYKQVLSD